MKKKIGINKAFDCVAFKREVQKKIYAAIKDMTPAQEIAYFQKQADGGRLGNWWRQVKGSGSASSTPKRARRSA